VEEEVDAVDGNRERGGDERRSDYFHPGNLDRIRDAPPHATAAVDRDDVMTMSELARRGFHLVDMSGEIWTMRRGG
jgi:hypothetical protein